MGPLQDLDLRESRPPVVAPGELQVEVTNGRLDALAGDAELVHRAGSERLPRHVVEGVGGLQGIEGAEAVGVEAADDDVGGARVPEPDGHVVGGLGPVGARRFDGYGVGAVVLQSRTW